MSKKSRSWCFTYNNPVETKYEDVSCRYIIVGDEYGEEKKTHHHQGYVLFKTPVTFKNVQKKLPQGCHIESANGSPQQNIAYCSKEKILCEYGDRPKMGKRNDIAQVKEIIDNKGGMRDVIDAVDSYQAMRCGELILKYKERKRDFKPVVKWFYGPTGTGKTRDAMEECKDPWISGKSLRWWCGYDAHKCVIIDDFRRDFCTFHELLRILDRYPYQIEVKGGMRQLLAELIIITSPFHPRDTYETREDIGQLLRRIDVIKEYKINGSPPAHVVDPRL